MDQILEDIEYKQYIDDGTEEGIDRWENVMELRRLALGYNQDHLQKFLEDVALVSDQDTIDENARVPTLLTLHAAKGLEFKQVFIVGVNEGVLPHVRSFEDPEAMEEERRLFYVGITRAMDQLYLTHVHNRYTFGYMEPVGPSRYLEDIPYDLREDPYSRPSPSRQEEVFRPWDDGLPEEDEPQVQKYSPGMKVKHPKWGKGVILGSELQDGDEIVDIFFDSEGMKKVISSLANLKIITEKD
jgi:DNA helicase-2/ATP-dependent DNA helicase PcrA